MMVKSISSTGELVVCILIVLVKLNLLKLNKLSNLNRIRAGQSLLLPVTSADAPVYTVVEHKIASGETVTGICAAYGLNYSSSKSMLEFLNPGMNFDRIRVGACIYLALTNTAA